MQKCFICELQTQQCCSLCHKVFYCSTQHQQVHWHTKHKFQCNRKIQQKNNNIHNMKNLSSQNDFKIYGRQEQKNYQNNFKKQQEQAKQFYLKYQQRIILRKECLHHYMLLNRNNLQCIDDLIEKCQKLIILSKQITLSYKPYLISYLQYNFKLAVNHWMIKLDLIADKVLLFRHLKKGNKLLLCKDLLFQISPQVEFKQTLITEKCSAAYSHLLSAIINVSQSENMDHISQIMYCNYIKFIQHTEGIWEQIYTYYNMGLWYSKKTYYAKAVKTYKYALQMMNSHKKTTQHNLNAIYGDCLYNLALCRYAIGEKDQANLQMQQAYRIRVKILGKNSIQTSQCLQQLGRWSSEMGDWQTCLHYLSQCIRIRKINTQYPNELKRIFELSMKIEEKLEQEKKKNQVMINPKEQKYYQSLLDDHDQNDLGEYNQNNQQTFGKQLVADQQQYVTFKVNITPEMAKTYSSEQWTKLNQLIDLTDVKMLKDQAIKLILQCQFNENLDAQQRDLFIKMNKFN